jgi:hypothetical protein
MGLVYRGGRPYFYRSVRRGGRVTSKYLGSGPVALWLAAVAGRERSAGRRDRGRLLAAEREADRIYDRVETAVCAALGLLGYHRHDRGAWRRRRDMDNALTTAGGTAVAAKPPLTSQEARELFDRANAGGEAVLAELRDYLTADPKGVRVAELFGNPGGTAAEALVNRFSGDEVAIKMAAKLKWAELRRELAGPDPSPIERLLADRAAYCWFWLYTLEMWVHQKAAEPRTVDQVDFLEKRTDRAHRRYLSALKSLAAVRRLETPARVLTVTKSVSTRLNVSERPAPEHLIDEPAD